MRRLTWILAPLACTAGTLLPAQCTPTTGVSGSPCGPAGFDIGFTGSPSFGTTFHVDMLNPPSGQVLAMFFFFDPLPTPVPLPAPWASGCNLFGGKPEPTPGGPLTGPNKAQWPVVVPNDPNLCGLAIYFQGFTLGPQDFLATAMGEAVLGH